MTPREKRAAIRRAMLDFADRLADIMLDEAPRQPRVRVVRLPSIDTTPEDEQDAERALERARRA